MQAVRERVPSGRWIGAGTRQSGKFWVATFANEGADKLADYIGTLRTEYRRMVADASKMTGAERLRFVAN